MRHTWQVRSEIARTSYFKVRSLLDRRNHPHPKNARKSASNAESRSLSASAKDGLTSRPVRSLLRMAKETQKHPSSSVRPDTNHGFSGTSTPLALCLLMRAGVLRITWISGLAGA